MSIRMIVRLLLRMSEIVVLIFCQTIFIGLSPSVAAEHTIRISLVRSVNTVPLWGIQPFAAKYGLKVEFVPGGSNADILRDVAGGVEVGTVGYQSPAIMVDQSITNVRIVAGVQTGLANLVMRKGEDLLESA